MGELAARAEVSKLARELSADPRQLAFLAEAPEDQVAALRRALSRTLFARHEPRLRRVAHLSKLLPPQLAARIAESALGPMLCGRIAGVLDVESAVRLAGHLRPPFLAEVSGYLDPDRTADIVRSLPDELVLSVARQLLDDGDYLTLGRFVAVIDDSIARRVMDMSSPSQLLQISVYAEDRARLDDLLEHVSDERLSEVIEAAADGDRFEEAVSLLVFLRPRSQQRLGRVLADAPPHVANGVVAAVVRLRAWLELLPVVGQFSPPAVRALVNVDTTRDPAVLNGLIEQVRAQQELVDAARELGYFSMIVLLIESLDDEHRAVLAEVSALDDPQLRAWAAQLVDLPVASIAAAVDALRRGEALPADIIDALRREPARSEPS